MFARINVENGSFSAKVEGSLTTEDFEDFRSQLAIVLERGDGSAVFSTLEDILHIEVRLNRAGQAQVSGRLRTLDRPLPSLSFAFDNDQTYLQSTLRDLDATLRSFPVRRKAEQE